MQHKRLLQALVETAPGQIDRTFGEECAFQQGKPAIQPAPVRRVVLFTESFPPKIDGVSKSAYLTLRYLQETGREVLVFAPDIAPDRVGPSRVIPCPSISLPFAPETRLAFPHGRVRHHLDIFQPDLIHLFSPVSLAVAGMFAGQRRRVPVVANYQTDLPAYTQLYGFGYITTLMRNWLRTLHNRCHLTLVPSPVTLRQLRDQGYHRLRIWRRGVDIRRFDPAHRSDAMRRRLLNGRDPRSLLCVYVGRLATEKRIDLLREVADLPGVALTLVGDGAERARLENTFAGTGTHFTGYLVGEDLAAAYASADAFLFPSPTETFGQVVQEALASGLPAVVINQGGVVDLVEHGATGLICPGDPAAFADAVRALQGNPALRARMAANARRSALQFPWETIMAQLEDYYRQAVELNRRYGPVARYARAGARALPHALQ